MIRPQYFVRRALAGMRQAPFVNAVAVVTIALSLFVVVVLAGVVGQVRVLLDAWGEDVVVTAYLKEDATADERVALIAFMRNAAGAGAVIDTIDREAALERLRASLGKHAGILEGLDENPLPASIEVHGAVSFADPARVERFGRSVGRQAGVMEVDYGQEWSERLSRLIELFALVGFVMGGFALLGSAVMVSNTIKLAVMSRKAEIEIMKLCGATDAFVRLPFLIEGLLQGLLGAALAGSGAALMWVFVVPEVQAVLAETFALQLHTAPPYQALGWLLVGGMVLGLGGSALSLGRFLRV